MAIDEAVPADIAGETDDPPLYIAKKLRDAQRLEEVFKAAGVAYEVEPDVYQGGVVFRSERVGAFFYVTPEWRERALAVMAQNGFRPLS